LLKAATFEWFVARRYLRAKRRGSALSLITVISISGVAAGVMALLIGVAVNNGFRNTLQQNLLGATPHVIVLEKEPGYGIENWREVSAAIRKVPHVSAATPALWGEVFLSGPLRSSGAFLKGVLEDPAAFEQIKRHIKEGSIEQLSESRGYPGILLGSKLAQNTGMLLDSVVTVISPRGENTAFGVRPRPYSFRVVGIFESGFFDLDNQFAFTTLKTAQRVFAIGDVVNSIEVRVDDLDRAPEIAKAVEAAAGQKLGATHWMEQNRQLLGALRMERTVSLITIGLIQLVAAINIFITLVMTVMDRKRDIAILLSMGAKRFQIRRLFILQGMTIGAIGTLLGLAAGYTLCYFADRYQWIPLDEAIYSLRYVPFQARAMDSLWIAGVALLISFVATLHPADTATKIPPAETLRYE